MLPHVIFRFAVTRAAALALCAVLASTVGVNAQGVLFRGMGAINESMGGAGIAAPLDSAGAIYTNPATLSGVPENEVAFGLGALMPESSTASFYRYNPQTGGALPPGYAYGKTKSKQDTYYCPSFAVARHTGDWTFGCAVGAIGGASANYAAPDDGTNPILGTYGKSSKVKVIELMPSAAYKYRDWISVGATAVVGCFSLKVDPMPFGRYPAATSPYPPDGGPLYRSVTDYTFGGGANIGVLFDLDKRFGIGVKTGFVVKSPVWAEPFQFNGATSADLATGLRRDTEFKFMLPLILGWGVSWTPHKDLLFALDLRYFDYANTHGFKPDSVLDKDGKIGGLGWDSILSVAVGVQYSVAADLKVRAGYCWSENPIPGDVQFANVVAPLFIQHVASVGLTYTIASTNTDISLTWSHAFKSSQGGVATQAPGNVYHVKNTVNAETIFLSITQRF
ncbi:MAG: outer membrane protein transport protein [Puniceicoccales bacterium]|jgi:long-chain fatty acid transport protein|nr:outer membrane protein transport protein [Puniceicoccales bacterium]